MGWSTLDEYLLDVFGPDFAGAILEHLVVLALGGDDGLAGGLALRRVEGAWMIHGVGRAVWDLEGLLYGSRTAQSAKDPERTKCARGLEMLYCRSGGQDADGDRLALTDNNIPLSFPNPRMALSPTQIWLREHSRLYSEPHAVYADTDALLARFPTIRPKTDVYSSPSLSPPRPRSPALHSVRRRTVPAAALSPRPPPHHLPPGHLQHPSRNLAHPRLPKGPPDSLCRSYSGHAHPLRPIHRP